MSVDEVAVGPRGCCKYQVSGELRTDDRHPRPAGILRHAAPAAAAAAGVRVGRRHRRSGVRRCAAAAATTTGCLTTHAHTHARPPTYSITTSARRNTRADLGGG